MIDNLTEAISHAKEVAEEQKKEAETWSEYKVVSEKARNSMADCLECAKDHEQLADWLTELKERREADRWIPITEALPDIALHVLVQLTNGWITIGHYHSTDKWVFIDGTMKIAFPRDTVVAWRYIPKAYESKAEKEVKIIEEEHSCVSCKFGNLYSDSEPCCNCTDDNDMYKPKESEEK